MRGTKRIALPTSGKGTQSVRSASAAPSTERAAPGRIPFSTIGTVWKKVPFSPAGSSPMRRYSAAM
jgi:hypothetical protein